MNFRTHGAALIAATALTAVSIPALGQDEEVMPTTYAAMLSGAAEVPAVETEAGGTFVLYFDEEAMTITWELHLNDLSGPATGAHIHGPASPAENAGVLIDLMGGDMAELGDMMGEGDMMGDDPDAMDGEDMDDGPAIEGSANITEEQASDLQSGFWYVNVHTDEHPAGEIRGQIRLGVPELQ